MAYQPLPAGAVTLPGGDIRFPVGNVSVPAGRLTVRRKGGGLQLRSTAPFTRVYVPIDPTNDVLVAVVPRGGKRVRAVRFSAGSRFTLSAPVLAVGEAELSFRLALPAEQAEQAYGTWQQFNAALAALTDEQVADGFFLFVQLSRASSAAATAEITATYPIS